MTVRTLRFPHFAAAALGLAFSGLAAAGSSDDRVAKLIERAAIERDRGDHRQAAELFAKADRAAGGRSIQAVAGLCQESLALGRWDDAVTAAERWIELAESPEVRAGGRHYLGVALHGRGLAEHRVAWEQGRAPARKPEPGTARWRETLELAAEELRAAASGVPANRHLTLLHLAEVLVQLDEYPEAIEVLDRYAAAAPVEDPHAAELRCWTERPASEDRAAVENAAAGAVTPPRKLHAPPPQYSERAIRRGARGRVILRAVIDRSGRVDCVQVLSGFEPSLDRSILDTVKRWRFAPATLDGEPVEVYYNLSFEFDLRLR